MPYEPRSCVPRGAGYDLPAKAVRRSCALTGGLGDPTEGIAKRTWNARRRFPYIDLPRQIHVVLEIDGDPRELVMLLLLVRQAEPVARHEQTTGPVHVEALVRVPSARTGRASVLVRTQPREMRKDMRTHRHPSVLEWQVLNRELLAGGMVGQEWVPRDDGRAVEPYRHRLSPTQEAVEHHGEMVVRATDVLEESAVRAFVVRVRNTHKAIETLEKDDGAVLVIF